MTPKIVKPALNVGARNIFRVIAAGSQLKLKQPAHERGGCAVDPNRLTDKPAFLNSVVDKFVFVNLEVCSSPVTAVCDTSAGVFCSSQRLLKRLLLQETADGRLLAAN